MKRLFILLILLAASINPAQACERILSLAPSATEVIFSIGLGPQVVGVTQFDFFPEEVKNLPKAGGYANPDLEASLRLQPDLVILVEANENSLPKFKAMGLNVLLVKHKDLQGVLDSFTIIGERCNKQKEAAREVAKLKATIYKIQNKIKGRPPVSVLITLNRGFAGAAGDKIFIAGQGTYFDDLIRIAGGKNAYQGGQTGYPMIGSEAIIRLDPDVVLDLVPHFRDKGFTQEKMLEGWQDLKGISAMENHRVHPINENYFNLPGPRLVLALEDMAKLFHSEVKW